LCIINAESSGVKAAPRTSNRQWKENRQLTFEVDKVSTRKESYARSCWPIRYLFTKDSRVIPRKVIWRTENVDKMPKTYPKNKYRNIVW